MCIRDRYSTLYTFVVENSRLWFEPLINSFFIIVVIRVWAACRMIGLFPGEDWEMLHSTSSVCAAIVMNEHNAPG